MVLTKNLGQIRSNVVKKVKKQTSSLGFFHILLQEYILMQKVVVIKPSQWTYTATNLGPNNCPIRVKNGKKLIHFS